ncbi:MAG: DUF547 domain-containing protein [Proteobacteria bacterium]|nr:DUF547 domain-containing protein [Pseudomonadota bacterium]
MVKSLCKRFGFLCPVLFIVSLSFWATDVEAKDPNPAQDTECKPFNQDHPVWTQFLKKWVKGDSINYSGAKTTGAVLLTAYLAELESVCKKDLKRWSKNQRMAFWINVYNAYTIKLVIDNHPLKSIREIGLLPGAAWRKKIVPLVKIKGKNVSLSHVQNDILRRRFREPRIHFALVSASEGCPPILAEAYTAAKLDRQLEHQTKAYLNDNSQNRYDADKGVLYLSKIFNWYERDFGKDRGQRLLFVGDYLDVLQSDLKKGKNIRIQYLPYDWSLNGY